MTLKNRRGFFLSATARRGLHGGILKDDQGHNDGIEVSAGFTSAAERMSGDDNRSDAQKGGATHQEAEDNPGDEGDQDGGNSDEDGDDQDDGNSDEDGDDQDDSAKKPNKDKRQANRYIRDLKRQNRELMARLEAVENNQRGSSTNSGGAANSGATSENDAPRPDPNDAKKYPLGVIDDGYVNDLAEWTAERKVRDILAGERAAERAQRERVSAEAEATELRGIFDKLSDKGSDLYDDFEEVVVTTGLRGDWPLTETTFRTAAEVPHGAEVLYELANDTAKAREVAAMSNFQQMKYVETRNAELEAKRKPRVKPQASDPPPRNAARGRNSSNPIRPDTDNLDDFRKIFYRKR